MVGAHRRDAIAAEQGAQGGALQWYGTDSAVCSIPIETAEPASG